jgi:hypothetical protein
VESFDITKFLGLKTSLAQPPGNSAKAIQNLVRFRHPGWLEQADGYAKKYDLPTTDAAKNISNVVITDIKNFYVKEHGGQNITVAVGTYTKESRATHSEYYDRSGIWIRPYWNVSWVDDWFELTEIEIFEAVAKSSTSDITLSTLDPYFPTNYFKNWTLVFEDYSQAQDADNYLLITYSYNATGTAYITYFGLNASMPRNVLGAKVIFVRNFIGQEMPASLTGMILGLYDEIRLTTGNTALDMLIMAGFRSKSFGWATDDKVTDRIIADRGTLDCWRYAFGFESPTQAISANPIKKGTYDLKMSLVTDDNQETDLRNPRSADPTTLGGGSSLAIGPFADATPPTINTQNIVSDGTYLYAVTYHPAIVYKIDPATMTVIDTPLVLNVSYLIMGIVYDGTYLYVVSGEVNGDIVKIDPTTLSIVKSVNIGLYRSPQSIISAFGYIYIGGYDNNSFQAFVSRVVPSTMIVDTTGSLNWGVGIGATVLSTIGTNLLVGYNITPNGVVEEISSSTLTTVKHIHLTNAYVRALYSPDTATVYAGHYTTPGKITKINWTTATEASIISLASGENLIVSWAWDGTYLFIVLESGKVINRFYLATMLAIGTTYDVATSEIPPITILSLGGYLYITTPNALVKLTTYSGLHILANGTTSFSIKPLVSAGAIMKRAKALRIYEANDGVNFYLLKELNILDGGITWEENAFYDPYFKHFYHRGNAITIDKSDFDARGALAQVSIGRTITDTGAYPFLVGCVAGLKTFVGNVLINGVKILNQVIASTKGTDGEMNDVFPNDAANVIDVEYSDGDQIMALVPLGERVFCLKGRNAILITPNPAGGYYRDIVDRGIGCCSVRAVNVYEETVYYADYNGLRAFNTNSGKWINEDWVLDWKAFTTLQKESACSIIDTVNRLWIVSVAGKQYAMEIDTGEWISYLLTDVPLQFADNAPDTINTGRIDFLSGTKIHNTGKGTRHNGTNFTMFFESNKIEPLQQGKYLLDVLPQYLKFQYESSVDISVYFYLNDSVTPLNVVPYTLPSLNTEILIPLPISARCKAFRIKFSATTTAASQTIKIKTLRAYLDTIEQGGDKFSFT